MSTADSRQTIEALEASTVLEALAIAWAKYNSRSGRASAKQVQQIMQQFKARPEDLVRMLAERGIRIQVI